MKKASHQSDIVGQSVLTSREYRDFIADLKSRIQSARISAARALNSEAILLYWDIGHGIAERQRLLGWGESVVELVSADLRREFPQATGFSARNVWDMRRLYLFYTATHFLDEATQEISKIRKNPSLRQLVAEIPNPPLRFAKSEAPPHQVECYRRGHLRTPIQTPGRIQRETPHTKPTRRPLPLGI